MGLTRRDLRKPRTAKFTYRVEAEENYLIVPLPVKPERVSANQYI